MIQQIGNALLALAHYTEDGVGDTALTVTVDVWEITVAGVATEVVTAGSATEVGDGLYRYILASGAVDAEALYVFVFKTADANTDQKELAMAWSAGAGWVERVDATLSDIEADTNELQTDNVPGLIAALNDLSSADAQTAAAAALTAYDPPTKAELDNGLAGLNDPTAAAIADAIWDELLAGHTIAGSFGEWASELTPTTIWTYSGTRSLTTAVAQVVDALRSDGDFTIYRQAYNVISFTGLTTGVDIVEAWFTMKASKTAADSAAWLQVSTLEDMEVIMGAAPDTGDEANCTLAADGANGTATLTIKTAAAAELTARAGLPYDLKYKDSNGETHVWTIGSGATVEHVITQATS